MGFSRLFIFGLVLNVAHCSEMLEKDMEIERHVTGVLGEAVFLRCQYLGRSDITRAEWKRDYNDARGTQRSKRLTFFKNNKAFTNDPDFSLPVSATNLTVRMNVSSLEAEGRYTCLFDDDAVEIKETMVLTVVARPAIHTSVTSETHDGTHYQSVTCSAANGKPLPRISWLVGGSPPRESSSERTTNTSHPDGTATASSVLRLPTARLQDRDSVTCVVQHPTLPDPAHIAVTVETFVAPNVTIEERLVTADGVDFWEVTCGASGGRPEAVATLALPAEEEEEEEEEESYRLQREGGAAGSSYRLPADLYDGQNVTCVFDHPSFTHKELRTLTLPVFYLSAVQLLSSDSADSRSESQATEPVELEEGDSNVTIGLEVIGDVPRYTVVCTKNDGPLPEGMEVVGDSLVVQGTVELQHGGLYECEASYLSHRASVKLDIAINRQVTQPVAVAPRIRIDIQERLKDRLVECLAADAFPAANVSWILPEGVSGLPWSNFTSRNGTHSVRSLLVLPVCQPQELSVECVIDHPAFKEPESRRLLLPLCAPPNITIRTSTKWTQGTAYTSVQCSVDSVGPAAAISWSVGRDGTSLTSELEAVQGQPEVDAGGTVSVRGSVRFPTANFSGQTVACVVEHPGLDRPERRQILVPELKAPVMSVWVGRQTDSPLWLSVCECGGEGVGMNLSWVLPENNTGRTYLRSHNAGLKVHNKLTYEFPLALHEGQDLTCLYQNEHGLKETRIAHVPRYCISSIRVLNQTTPLSRRRGSDPIVYRLALRESVYSQRIQLKINGSVPAYRLTCHRRDGSLVPVEGTALVFQSGVTEREAGLYTCHASFYHLKATVLIQVEVTSTDQKLVTLAVVCFSSAAAITIFITVTLFVCCKQKGDHLASKKCESLAALTSTMQGPCSPELKKAAGTEGRGQEYAQLISYNIVIDVRTTV